MSSIYRKAGSKKVWIRYKDASGRWKGKPTRYTWANLGDVRQARLLARRQSEIEEARGPASQERLVDWVGAWLGEKYSGADTTTLAVYRRTWRTVCKFLVEHRLHTAGQITREHAGVYLRWRLRTAGRNTAISDLKLLAMAIDEAKARGHCTDNPLRRLGLKKEGTRGKEIWSDEAIGKAARHLQKSGTHWMRCVFFLGLYQACRLRQCEIPLGCIRLDLGVIQWPGDRVKGGEGYSQPIDPRFRPLLEDLVKNATGGVLCRVPWDASLRLRRALDRAGLPGLCHHGLRATWITRAAEAGVAESQAMAFCHHSSREVHRVYKRLSSVGIAHVPELVSLPSFGSGDWQPARRGSAPASSGSQIAADTPSPRRHKSSNVPTRKTPPTRKA